MKSEDIRRIGQLLNVETVLEGSVRKSGNRLRVTAQLVKVRDGFHLWSERYDREMKDVFDIQDDISRAIVAALEVQWGGQADAKLVRPQATRPELCPQSLALGRAYWVLGDREAALVELHRAVELSGRSPLFLSTLGQALALSGEVGHARQIQRELTERTIPAPTRPYFLSHLHAALGEDDLAFAALEQALVERESLLRWLPAQRSFNDLASLESDPRWPVFIDKVKAAVEAGTGAKS